MLLKRLFNVTELFNRFTYKRRTDNVLHASIGAANINGDYINSQYKLNTRLSYKRYLNSYFNLSLGANKFNLSNENIPFDKLTPYAYVGGGTNISNNFNTLNPKVQAGIGIEYLVTERIGITGYAENNFVFSDNVDGIVRGTRDDMYLRFGVGLNLYIGNYNTKKDLEQSKLREERKALKRIKKDNIKKGLLEEKVIPQEERNEKDKEN